MCGVAGFLGEGDLDDLVRMTTAIAHRGPDAAAHLRLGRADGLDALPLHLGHRRLSILDIEGGAQPMRSVSGRTVIVFNGEIYNHLELRSELIRDGRRFATENSDTETLLVAYEAWGEAMAPRLNGMFAFAIVDLERQRLLLMRDRFGQKPLYWTRRAGFFAFSSELTALLAHPLVPRSPSTEGLMKLLAYGFCPSPNTMIDGVQALEPGSLATVDLRDLAVRTGRYFEYRVAPDRNLNASSLDEISDQIGETLAAAVKRCLLSDVEVGALLSGGIDSSLVTALAQQALPKPLSTFSIGFEETSFDESAHAAALADHVGARISIEKCRPADMRAAISDVLPQLDEPFCDASILPTWMVCRNASRSLKVALTGDGADELFAGYDPFAALVPAELFYALVPGLGKRLTRALAARLPKSDGYMSFDFKLRRALDGASYDEPFRAPIWLGPLNVEDLNAFFGTALTPEEIYSEALDHWTASSAPSAAERLSEYFARFYLCEGVLRKTDRASMLNSLELRAPFLDNEVAALAARLPLKFKMAGGVRKRALRGLAERLTPPEIVGRKKQGFGVPIHSWLRDRHLIPESSALSEVNPAARSRMIDEHATRRRDWRYVLWTDLVLNRSPLYGHARPTELREAG